MGDVSAVHAFILEWRSCHNLFGGAADLFDRHHEIGIEEHRSNQFRAGASPILERLGQKIGDRQNHSTQVPHLYDYVSERDFFDVPVLSLHHHHIADFHGTTPNGHQTGNNPPK